MSCTWGYDPDNGPRHWYKSFPAARGFQQSPIDLTRSGSVLDRGLNGGGGGGGGGAVLDRGLNKAQLTWKYDPADSNKVVNNGHTVTVQVDGDRSSLTGGPIVGEFKLAQFHFHWGCDNDCGSEHTLEGSCFPAEVHLVHYNTFYGEIGNAVDKPDGLCVLGAFIEVGHEHQGVKELLKLLPRSCSCKGCEVDLQSVDPATLLPDSHEFFTYRGSLTTPPLFESVQWVNFLKPIQFSEEQLSALRSLSITESGDGPKMVNNFRPICPVLNRKVTRNFSA